MPFVGKNNLSAKDLLFAEAIVRQPIRERQKAEQAAREKARQWVELQMDNADKGPMHSPREMISLGGQALTSGTVQTAADAIQRMRQQMLEQEQQRKEEERRRALYQPKPEQTARDLAGMRLDAGDFAKMGGQTLTSGTVQSAAKSLGSYKQSKQPSGPVKVDFMGVSSERDARLELLNENLRRLEDQRKMQEAKAAPNREERQAQQEAFWRDRALSAGYSPNSSVQMSTRQQEAAEKAGALKNQERELGQYIKYLEGQGVQDRAQNAVTERDVQRGLNSTIEKGDITTGNEKVRSLARAIQYGKLGLEPHGFNETDISANMKWASALTERQKDTILAFAGREDWDGAQRYLDSISDQLNQKVAESEYNDLGTAGKALYWAPAGIDQFASGIAQLGDSEARNQTVTNRVSQMVQQDAYDTHPGLGFLYDMGTSISNMTPSILLSAVAGPALGAAGLSASTAGAVAGGIGSAALGASAGGNAYAEKRRQGYGTEEAAAYATLVGASEAGLQYVLGGISKLGATPLAKATEMVSKIDNAFGQAALHLGANMLSEGVEEGLQSVLEPAFATLILDEKYQVSPQEVVTSFLMGALTAGLLEGMGAVRAGRAGQEVARNGGFDATAVDGYMGESGVDYFRGVTNAGETSQALDILDDYYGLSRGQNEDVRAEVERQYAMRSAWYEGRDQARRATEQTATEETQQDNVGQEWTQVDTNGQNGTPDTQAAEPEGLRLGAMWEDAQSQTAQGTPQEAAGADQTARLVQEARETVQAARAAQEAQNQEGQFQRVQPVNTAQPEGLTLGATLEDNEASNPQNLNEGAGVNGREEDAAPAAGAATTAGRDLLDGEPGRVYGQGPGQQAGVVEEGPAGAAQTSEQGRAASARHDLAKNLRGQEVSSRQLGLSRGTDTANVLVMPQELWDTEMVQVAQEVQARTGSAVTYVLGDIEVSGTDGSVSRVRGVQMPGQIIVRADHRRLSVEQIAKHEEFHVYAGRNTNMVRDAENRIMAKYDQAEFQTVINTYIKNLRGVIDIPTNGTSEQVVEAYYRILEEIFADAYAGINAFGVETSRYQETVREVSQEREAIRASRENAKATERKTGPTDTAKENGAGVRDGGVEEAESAEQSSEEDAKKQEVYRQAKEMRDALRDAYAEGRISEAEYDAAMDVVLERVDVDGGSMLEMWDRWDREEGWERYSAEDEETLNEFAIGDDGNIYLPGQPMPEAVRRMRNQAQSMSEQANGPEKLSVEDEKNDDRDLKEDASGRMLSKEQRVFFEESMARVEENGRYRYGYGRIVPVYHVTDSDFTVFDKGKLGENTDANVSDELMAATAHVGFWFNTQNLVGSFGSKSGEYYLDIKNMYQVGSLEELCRDINEFAEEGTPKERGESFAEWLKGEGYDGVVLNDEEFGGISFIALDPNQIKRTDNRTPTRSDDVRFSVEDEETLAEFAIGDDGHIYLPGQPMPDAVKRMRAKERFYTEEDPDGAEWARNGSPADWEQAERAAIAQGYPVLNGHQVVPMKTWVFDKKYENYGLVVRLPEESGKLGVLFYNKEYGTGAYVDVPIEQLEYREGKYSMLADDLESLMRSEPENVDRPETWYEHVEDQNSGGENTEPWNGVDIESMPRKARNHLSRAERAMVRKLGDLLSVPTAAQREYLQETARAISEEYLKEGRISQKTVDRLFENAYDQGIVVKEGLMDEYRDLYDRLRNTELVFSKEYHGDIADFEAFRRKYQNRLRIKTKGRTNIDQVYMELAEDWPGFFDTEKHTHPSDQLEQIAKVMDGFKKVEMSLDAYYGGDEDFKRWAKHDFEVAVTDMLGDLRNVKRYTDERAAAKAEQQEAIPKTQAEVEESWRKVKEARKKYEKVNAKSLLTNDDKVAVGQLLRGEIELEHLDPDKLNVKDIRAVYQAKEEYERLAKGIKTWNRSRKEQAKAEADTFLETANDWKDKPAGILYSRETMERNIRDIIKDKELAQRLIDTYFAPVHKGAAAATRMKNTYRERVRNLGLSRKVEKGNVVSEAHAVQLLGEAEDNIRVLEQMKGQDKKRDGKTLEEWRSVVAELWEQNPNLDEGKIRNAVKEFRVIYDDLFQQMNEVRVRNGYEPVNYRQGYFPHFQPGNEEGIMAAFGRAMGISTEVTALPTTINGLTHTFRPGIRWFGNAQERLGFNTAYDAVEGFDRYIEGVADVILQTDNIQRLRALASQIRYRTGDEGIRRQVDAVRDNTTLAEQDKESRIEKIYKNGRFALSNFVVELDEYTNLLANKKSRADRNMEQNFGRNKFYNFMKWVEKRVAANMVAINPGSWLTNFIPLTQGRASLDRWMLLRGMWDTLRAYKGDGGFVDTSTFLTNRRGSDPIVKSWSQSASAVLSKPMEYIDQFTADSLVRARYRQNVKRGMSEAAAMDDADAWAAGVMADRSKGSMPTLFEHKNPLAKMFTQFQLEVNNQLSYVFKDVPREAKEKGLLALAVALLKFAVGAFLYNEVYEFVVGRRPALDPIGMLNDTVGDLTGWELPNLVELGVDAASGDLTAEDFQTDRGKLYDAAEGLAGNVAEDLPFISGFLGGGRYPVMNALPDFQNAARAALDSDWNTEKKLYELSSGFENPLTYLLLPFGGGQLKKIYNGVKAAVQGGKYSVNSDGEEILQYPMFMDSRGESIANVTRAILFGTTSLPTGQEWVEEGFKSLTAEQTVAYKWMMEEGVTGREAFYLIKELRSATKTDDQSKAQVQRDILEKAGLNDGALEAAYYTMVATNKEREIIDAMEEAGADTGVVTRALMELKQADATTQAAVERVLKSVQGLTNAERRKLWQLQDAGWDEKNNPF